jgi:hypothetical protein
MNQSEDQINKISNVLDDLNLKINKFNEEKKKIEDEVKRNQSIYS